jgi:sulfoxide reductase heme-binding subunit YedZ
MATFLILLALAVTSTTGWIRRLGRKWQQLHRLVYLAAVGSVVHFWWLVKADVTKPLRWAVALSVLLLFRVWWMWRSHVSSPVSNRHL